MQFHPNDLSDLDELTEEHLGFSALSEGLGFAKPTGPHPATQKSRETPAASASKAATGAAPEIDDFEDDLKPLPVYSGAGAMAAGPARPAPGITSTKPKITATAAAATPTPSAATQVLQEPAAPRSLRAAAFLVDALIVSLPLYGAWWMSFGEEAGDIFLQDPKTPVGLFAVIFAVYFLLSESFGGQSLGKMIFGLRVIEDDKYQKPAGFRYALARLGLFILGAACLGLGFLASFWDGKRRPWHDRYSGSIVRRRA